MPFEGGASGGPHLSAAFLCEKVLTEKDGVNSFVRVVDRFTVPIIPEGLALPAGTPPPGLQATLVVTLKSGGLGTGEFSAKIVMVNPDGSTPGNPQPISVFFNGGDENGVNILAPINLLNPTEGLYWFDIFFEDGLITRVPMRIFRQPLHVMQQRR